MWKVFAPTCTDQVDVWEHATKNFFPRLVLYSAREVKKKKKSSYKGPEVTWYPTSLSRVLLF